MTVDELLARLHCWVSDRWRLGRVEEVAILDLVETADGILVSRAGCPRRVKMCHVHDTAWEAHNVATTYRDSEFLDPPVVALDIKGKQVTI